MRSPAFLLLFSVLTAALAEDPVLDATAKYLAGLPVRGTPLEAASLEPAWADHATEFDRAWAKLEARQLTKIRAWAPEYLGSAFEDRGPMFYFFSGPDFLYAHAFFPNASTYVLCGTEAVGPVPDLAKLSPAALGSSLANLRKSLNSVLSWSFFITKDMKADLTQTQLNGTLPVLFVFLARAGCRLEAATAVNLDKNGQISPGAGPTRGLQIDFFGPSGRAQTLYYFTTDLANDGIKANGGFLKFCERQGRGASLLKAASYLLHEEGFSRARDFLLTQSNLILEDDSGIPHRFFAGGRWALRYCGHYAGPIAIFKQFYQPDLAQAQEASHPLPLDFGFGYQWQPGQSSLLIATPK